MNKTITVDQEVYLILWAAAAEHQTQVADDIELVEAIRAGKGDEWFAKFRELWVGYEEPDYRIAAGEQQRARIQVAMAAPIEGLDS